MSLIAGNLANTMIQFSEQQNASIQTDPIQAQIAYYNKLEDAIYHIIKNATISIPPTLIQVYGVSGISTNAAPIVLQNSIS